MNYTKIQQNIIKDILNGKLSKYELGYWNEKIAVLVDGYAVVLIPKPMYLLDTERILDETHGMLVGESFFKTLNNNFSASDLLENTGELFMRAGDKKPLVVFRNAKNERIYVSTALLDIFKTTEDVKYYGTTPKTPVFICTDDGIVGVVSPVKI